MTNLWEKIKHHYEHGDPSHDGSHIARVTENCRRLGLAEGANLEILLPAVLLHDVVNVPKNHPDRANASALAAKKAKEYLRDSGYGEAQIEAITQVIIEHSYSAGKKPTSLESALLQDGDRLDALGAIGVMRTVSCGVTMGATYYDLTQPFAKDRLLNDKKFTLDHFFVKLLKLPALMNTASARREAEARVLFMETFLEQLGREINSR